VGIRITAVNEEIVMEDVVDLEAHVVPTMQYTTD
jgi:hypothetical protein